MAEEKPKLTIVQSPAAIDELDEIWKWIALRYGVNHADRYLIFLKGEINRLADEPEAGRAFGARPALRYLLIRRRSRGHGHVAVYRREGDEVRVLHVFHTAQNWRVHVEKEN